MIRYYYKYMPIRANFFERPMLRATPPANLNDPFEASITLEQVQNVLRHEGQYYNSTESLETEYDLSDIVSTISDELQEYGIVSFTEDNSNLLMWAHYANEHAGMVVEFSNDSTWLKTEKPSDKLRFPIDIVEQRIELPQRVIYKDNRPLFELQRDAIPKNSKEEVPFKRMVKMLFLSKGDKWLYEKEHRSILKISDADTLIFSNSQSLNLQYLKRKGVTYSRGKGKFTIERPRQIQERNSRYWNGTDLETVLSAKIRIENNPIGLFDIDPTKITAIYFGCKVRKHELDGYINFIRSASSPLSHVRIYHAKIRDDRHGLVFDERPNI